MVNASTLDSLLRAPGYNGFSLPKCSLSHPMWSWNKQTRASQEISSWNRKKDSLRAAPSVPNIFAFLFAGQTLVNFNSRHKAQGIVEKRSLRASVPHPGLLTTGSHRPPKVKGQGVRTSAVSGPVRDSTSSSDSRASTSSKFTVLQQHQSEIKCKKEFQGKMMPPPMEQQQTIQLFSSGALLDRQWYSFLHFSPGFVFK